MFVFHNRHHFAGAVGLFNQKHFIGSRVAHLAVDAFKCGIGFFLGAVEIETLQQFGVAHFIGGRIVHFVIPAAGIGAGALVGVAVVEIAREQAAAGIGDAQCAVHKHFQLDIGALLADFGNFFDAQFARQNNAFHADFLPEFHAPPVGGVGLHRQMNRHFRPAFAHVHNQAGVGHNQRIGLHGNQRFHIGHKGFQLAVVRQGVYREKEFLVARVRFANALLQHFKLGKFIIARAQRIARAAGIHGIGAIVKRSPHALEAAGGQ